MSYECAFAIAMITNRTIILPKNFWSIFIVPNQTDKSTWVDLWDICDYSKVKSYLNSVFIDDVNELKPIEQIATNTSYTGNINNHLTDIYYYKPTLRTCTEDHTVFVNNIHSFIKDTDFHNFTANRRIEDLNRNERFLHFENCLFGHYWYHIYPGNTEERNRLKSAINNIFRYKDFIYELAEKVKGQIGPYNALHMRRNDFLFFRKDHYEQTIGDRNKLLSAMLQVFPTDVPIYIATDETDKSFFDDIRKHYNIFFYSDFNYEYPRLISAALEQTICALAEYFLGTYFSTFTKRINIMRGIDGRQAADYSGINHIQPTNLVETHTTYPWFYRDSKRWDWNDSSYIQWCKE